MKVLFVGDIIGKPGRMTLKVLLPRLVERYKLELVIANGENAAGGFGLTDTVALEIFSIGVNVITSGNHIWDKKEYVPGARVLRPANYPPGVPGYGSAIFRTASGVSAAVLNMAGRVFMASMDCPFRVSDEELKTLKKETDVIIVDFHAEATSEKIAYGLYMDGRVSAVVGTHTHVQTADEKILPGGTAYITDVGMTGPSESVIGVKKEQVLGKFLTGMPKKFEVASGPTILSAVVIDIKEDTGKASAIQRLLLTYP